MHAQVDALDLIGRQLCSLRSWMQASIAGWMTMPQANGL